MAGRVEGAFVTGISATGGFLIAKWFDGTA